MSKVLKIKLLKVFTCGILSGAFLIYTHAESSDWIEFVNTVQSAVLAIGGVLGGLWAYLTFGNHAKRQETTTMITALKNYHVAYQNLHGAQTLLLKELSKIQENPDVRSYYNQEIVSLESRYLAAENTVLELLDTSIEISDGCRSKIFMLITVYGKNKNVQEVLGKIIEVNNLLRKEARVRF